MFQEQPIGDIRYYCPPRTHLRPRKAGCAPRGHTHASSKLLCGLPFRHTFRCPQYRRSLPAPARGMSHPGVGAGRSPLLGVALTGRLCP